jgi:hypothetical protein
MRALGRLLPGPDETHLLRAILHRGPSAHEAWQAFGKSVQDLPALFRTDTGNRKRLSPLLLTSVRENGLDADPRLATVVKTATLREELRVDILAGLAGAAYRALGEAGVPFLVLRGAALMERGYAEPAHRHAHDIDVLVPPGRLDDAVRAVRDVGFDAPQPLPWGQGRVVRHRTELPIRFVERAFRLPFYALAWDPLAERAVRGPLAGVDEVPTPDATDALLLALGRAAYCPGRSNLVWIVDAWMLIERAGAIDWDALVARASAARLELPLTVQLRYLRDEVGAAVPEQIPAALERAAPERDGLRRDVALFGARQNQGAHPELERRARPPLAERWTLLRWELLPSADYLSWAYGDPPRVLLPLIYLTRPFSALAERVRWAVLRRIRRGAGDDA